LHRFRGKFWPAIRTDNVLLEVTLDGQISVEPAKAAVTEVFENLKKADFSKVK